jgi:hypothetical protein
MNNIGVTLMNTPGRLNDIIRMRMKSIKIYLGMTLTF